jgi:hypothetical protein
MVVIGRYVLRLLKLSCEFGKRGGGLYRVPAKQLFRTYDCGPEFSDNNAGGSIGEANRIVELCALRQHDPDGGNDSIACTTDIVDFARLCRHMQPSAWTI